jgi:hypothetical protein
MLEIKDKVRITNIIRINDDGRAKYLNTMHIITKKIKTIKFPSGESIYVYGFDDTPSQISEGANYFWEESELEKSEE